MRKANALRCHHVAPITTRGRVHREALLLELFARPSVKETAESQTENPANVQRPNLLRFGILVLANHCILQATTSMPKVAVIMPAAGASRRFRDQNYKKPLRHSRVGRSGCTRRRNFSIAAT